MLPLPVRHACEQAAADGGYASLSDYLVAVIAREVEMPDFAPAPKFAVPDQEKLVS